MDTADVSELLAWAKVLERAGADAQREGEGIVSKGSLNIKKRARELAPGGVHTPYYPDSINYDLIIEPGDIIGETGPAEGRRQRGLGNILEYGTSHNPPHPHLEPALDEEEPRFYEACEDLAARLLERYG